MQDRVLEFSTSAEGECYNALEPSGGERKAVDADRIFEKNVRGKPALRFAPKWSVRDNVSLMSDGEAGGILVHIQNSL